MKQSCAIYKYVLIINMLYVTYNYIKMKEMEPFPPGALTKQSCTCLHGGSLTQHIILDLSS